MQSPALAPRSTEELCVEEAKRERTAGEGGMKEHTREEHTEE